MTSHIEDINDTLLQNLPKGTNKVISIRRVEKTGKVYDLEVNENKNFFVKNIGLCKNGGRRSGAFTVALPIWHADIEDFLDCQTEAGDLRKKSFDIQPQICMHDIFMRLKDDYGNEWHTFCPHEVESKLGIKIYECYGQQFEEYYSRCVDAYKQGVLKVCQVHDAKKLFIRIMEVAFETGLPYMAFIDAMNEANPNKHEGFIPCGNLCQESFSVVVPDKYFHTCNLMSLVVGRISMDRLEKVAAFTLRMLDNGIALTNPPLEGSRAHNERFRTVGIGIQGLHDLVAREHANFLDERFMTEVAERIQYGAVTESIKLAKERGAYPAFEGSDWQNGTITRRYKKHSVVAEYDWDYVQSQIDIYGIRNSQLTSPAPNCMAPDAPFRIYEDGETVIKTIHDLLRENGVDYFAVESAGIPKWIDLVTPRQVPTYEGDAVVERIWYNGEKITRKITFEDGNTYEYTLNHKLLVLRDNEEVWVPCGSLEVLDEVIALNMDLHVCKVVGIQESTSQTYDLEVKEKHHYLMENGVVSHNTSSSIFMDAAAGVMPVYSAFFYEDNANGTLPVAGMFLADNPLSYSRDVTKFYPWALTKTVGALQKFIDTGISAEYIMDKNNPEFNAKFLWRVYDEAWKNKNKTVYYIRTIKQGEQLVKGAESCAGCAG